MAFRAVFLLAFALLVKAQTDDYLRFCYYTNWSQYRPDEGQYWPENIDPFLCTHIFHAFAIIDENNEVIPFEFNDEELYSRLNALKDINPNLKTLLGVGGWNFAMNQTTIMLDSPESRQTFIDSAIPFLRTHGFDGLDLDFEYPGAVARGSKPIDKFKYTELVIELKAAFEQEASDTGNTQLLLTAAVGAGKQTIDEGYQVEIIAQYLDYIQLMAYDLNGAWANYTGINAPLYPRDEEEGDQRFLNVDFAVNYWLEKGAIKERLLLGIAFYGRCFTLTSEETGLGAPADGPAPEGPFTREAGFYAYYEICLQPGTKVYNEEHQAPYSFRDNFWVGYDDYRSIACKVQYMMDKDLAGFFVWAIDLDDFEGAFCNAGAYPLFNHILDVMDGDAMAMCFGQNGTTVVTNPTTTPGTQPTGTPPPLDEFCDEMEDGLHEHPFDCTQFIECVGDEEFVTQCPECLIFDTTTNSCDYPCEDGVCYNEPCDAVCM